MAFTYMKGTSKEEIWHNGGRIAVSAYVASVAQLQQPIDIADNVTVYGGTQLGKFSYINVGCVIYSNVQIGKFCSIGRIIMTLKSLIGSLTKK